MSISAECQECGRQLDAYFNLDSDGDGSVTIERCACEDENISESAVDNFIEYSTYIDERIQEAIQEHVDVYKEELAKEVIANVVENYKVDFKEE